jgi:hypothetical protein
MKSYCPACATEVNYEGSGYNASCSICGRTKSAAEQTVRSRAEQQRSAKLKWVWVTLGAIGAIGLLGLYALSGGSDSMTIALVSSIVQVVTVTVFIWLFLKIKNWFSRRSEKK